MRKKASHFGDMNSREFILLVKGLNSFIVLRILIIAILGVHIFFPVHSIAEGLSASREQLWHQGSEGVTGDPEKEDAFGRALSSGDFNNDGYEDLAVGVPFEDVGGIGAGAVNVLYGSVEGLSVTGEQVWHQDSEGIKGETEAHDWFGYALGTGDFNNDGYDDLAIGVLKERIGNIVFGEVAGAVNVLYGSVEGLSATGDQIWHQDSEGIKGIAELADYFGYALSTGDFNNDGYDDLAIGVPQENINPGGLSNSIRRAGSVNVLYGSVEGLSATGDQIWHQKSEGIIGGIEEGDTFGKALSSGDFNGDGYADLAIGVPGEGIESIGSAGAVNVLYGTAEGLAATGNQMWHQDSEGIKGKAEPYDNFGYALSTGDFNNDGYADLAIGVPYEDIGSISDAGGVHVLYGTADGLSAAGNQEWHQDSEGISDGVEEGDAFGRALSSGDFNNDGYDDLAVGVPYEDIGSIAGPGVVNVLYGTSEGLSAVGEQMWFQDNESISGETEAHDWFGFAICSSDFNNDSYSDLAIGVPGESIESISEAGAVNIIYGEKILSLQGILLLLYE